MNTLHTPAWTKTYVTAYVKKKKKDLLGINWGLLFLFYFFIRKKQGDGGTDGRGAALQPFDNRRVVNVRPML